MSLDILYFLAVNRTQNNIDLPKYVFHFEMLSRFLALKASSRPTPVIFAAQKQAEGSTRPSGCHQIGPVKAWHPARHPNPVTIRRTGQPGRSEAATFSDPGLPLSQEGSAFRDGASSAALPHSRRHHPSASLKPQNRNCRPCQSKAGCWRGASGWACKLGTLPLAHEGQPLETTPAGLELVPHFRAKRVLGRRLMRN